VGVAEQWVGRGPNTGIPVGDALHAGIMAVHVHVHAPGWLVWCAGGCLMSAVVCNRPQCGAHLQLLVRCSESVGEWEDVFVKQRG
jgi:hypothetical protein